jgi:phospholipid-binding lipoprotein MlaA
MSLRIRNRALRGTGCAIAVCLALSGCATGGVEGDPLEASNRAVFAFNESFDKNIAKPVARGYQKIVPGPLNQAVSNFFANLADFGTAVNNLLQGKLLTAIEDAGRIVFNSTFGLGGLIDFASGVGMPKHSEDFGQTLGRWGVDSGPYLVLPILGPSSTRDTVGLAVDAFLLDPVFYVDDTGTEIVLAGVRAVDYRAGLFKTEKILDEAALDRYDFIRDAYLQHRESQVYDGNPNE